MASAYANESTTLIEAARDGRNTNRYSKKCVLVSPLTAPFQIVCDNTAPSDRIHETRNKLFRLISGAGSNCVVGVLILDCPCFF